MKNIFKDNIIELLAIALVFVDIFYGIIPPIPLLFGLVVLSIFRSGLIGAYVLSSYAMPILLGSALYYLNITGIATIVQIILFVICLYQWMVRKNIDFYNFEQGFKSLFIILAFFILSSLITSGGDYAFTKIKDTVLCGFFVYFAFGFLFSNPQKCNYTRIGLYLILYSFLMLLISPLFNLGGGPNGFLDFGYLRAQNNYVFGQDLFIIDYQHVGFFATMGCGIILYDSKKRNINNTFLFVCVALCSISSLYSGARQFVIISIVLLLLWAIYSRKKGGMGIVFGIVGVVIIIELLDILFSSGGMLFSVKEEGYMIASSRDGVMRHGMRLFRENPIIGVGYGRFSFGGRYGLYPHNLFVEILCELGIIGLVFLISMIYKPARYLILNQKACLYLLIVFFLRSMTSGGLDSNIILFSYIFAVGSLKYMPNNNIVPKQ